MEWNRNGWKNKKGIYEKNYEFGSHVATPQLGVDSLLTSCYIVTQLQAVLSRETEPGMQRFYPLMWSKAAAAIILFQIKYTWKVHFGLWIKTVRRNTMTAYVKSVSILQRSICFFCAKLAKGTAVIYPE